MSTKHTSTKFKFLPIAASLLFLTACSHNPPPQTTSPSATQPPAEVTGSIKDTDCAEFPVPLYPKRTRLSCESDKGPPLRRSAYIDSEDSVQTIAEFYKTQVQKDGWTVDPMEVEKPQHTVVSMKKGKGYATVVINDVVKDQPTVVQIHAYPEGN